MSKEYKNLKRILFRLQVFLFLPTLAIADYSLFMPSFGKGVQLQTNITYIPIVNNQIQSREANLELVCSYNNFHNFSLIIASPFSFAYYNAEMHGIGETQKIIRIANPTITLLKDYKLRNTDIIRPAISLSTNYNENVYSTHLFTKDTIGSSRQVLFNDSISYLNKRLRLAPEIQFITFQDPFVIQLATNISYPIKVISNQPPTQIDEINVFISGMLFFVANQDMSLFLSYKHLFSKKNENDFYQLGCTQFFNDFDVSPYIQCLNNNSTFITSFGITLKYLFEQKQKSEK